MLRQLCLGYEGNPKHKQIQSIFKAISDVIKVDETVLDKDLNCPGWMGTPPSIKKEL